MIAEQEKEDSLAARYLNGLADRQPYLDRARECSKLTIPSVFPPEGRGSKRLKTPFQGIGALMVNSLTAKALLSVLPVGHSFFRLDPHEIAIRKLSKSLSKAQQADTALLWHEGLAQVERTVNRTVEASALRAKLAEVLKQMIIGGNALLYCEDPKNTRVFRLDSYVVELDPMGNLLDCVVKETVSKRTLKKSVLEVCGADKAGVGDKEVDVYTGVSRVDADTFETWQEINGVEVPESRGSYPADKLPWMPLRWGSADGESYCYSYVDQYLGDLVSLEGLSKAIVQGSAAAAKVIFLVKSTRGTSKRALSSAPNGAFIDGDVSDVGTLQLNKAADFRVAQETMREIEKRLQYAFLMTTAIQRNGERVTAEEIRRLATELEDQLGGIYSALAQTLQYPLVNVLIAGMERRGTLPALPKGLVQISVTTGLDALGRSADADKLTMFKSDIADIPNAVNAIRLETLVSRFAVARGVDTENLIKSREEMVQETQQQQMAAMAQQVGTSVAPDVIKQAMQQAQGAEPVPA